MTDLEDEPDFEPLQNVLAKRVEQAQADQDQELIALAQQLTAALQNTPTGQQTLAKYHITNSNIGVVGDHARIEGGIHFGKNK